MSDMLNSKFYFTTRMYQSLGLSKKKPLLEASPISENLFFAFLVENVCIFLKMQENVCIFLKMQENVCIFFKMQENVCIFMKMQENAYIFMKMQENACIFSENARKCVHFQ